MILKWFQTYHLSMLHQFAFDESLISMLQNLLIIIYLDCIQTRYSSRRHFLRIITSQDLKPILKKFTPMITAQEYIRKANKQTRLSNLSHTSKKSLTHNQKITTIVKNSKLKTHHTTHRKKSSKSRHSNVQQKQNIAPYFAQVHNDKKNSRKSLNSVSKTLPMKIQTGKMLEFPFQAIRFKEKPNIISENSRKNATGNWTGDHFFIQYDEPQQIDMSLLDNSKKIINSYNQRVSRYHQSKRTNKPQSDNSLKDIPFCESVHKLFELLDPHQKGFFSLSLSDHKKIPQAALYFLGGVFQRIRQNNITMSQKQFQQECLKVYLRSSNEDIQWFIEQIRSLAQPRLIIKKDQAKHSKIQIQQQAQQDAPIKVKAPLGQNRNFQNKINTNVRQGGPTINTSFDHQNSFVSFRRQTTSSRAMDYPSQRFNNSFEGSSYESAKFGFQNNQKISFNMSESQSFGKNQYELRNHLETDKIQSSINNQNTTQSLASSKGHSLDQITDDFNQQYKAGEIRKNVSDKAQDIREQIYAKLDKMTNYHEQTRAEFLRQNFRIAHIAQGPLNKQQIPAKGPNQFQIAQKNVSDKSINQNSLNSYKKTKQSIELNEQIKHLRYKQSKQPKWTIRNKNCEQTFSDLQKLKNQFQRHKDTVEQRQKQRQNYSKDQSKRVPNILTSEYSALQNQSWILKKNTNLNLNINSALGYQKNSALGYQKNTDRLCTITMLKGQHSQSINAKDNLTNSCRKPVDISLPRKQDAKKVVSLSQKKGDHGQQILSKVDKIDLLSQKLEQYLMKNALKIQYSKNFTGTSGNIKSFLYN